MTTIQSLSNSIHSNEMALAKQRQDLKDREQLEQQKASEKETIATLDTQLKVSFLQADENSALSRMAK